MILVQFLLIAAFAALLVRFLANPNSHQIKAWEKILSLLFVLVAIVAVVRPEVLSFVARHVGVGRGTDLLVYLLTLAFIFAVFTQYADKKQDQKRLVALARHVALLEAKSRYMSNE